MKINHKIFNLPPFISTAWSNIQTLRMSETTLVVTLNDGESILIPEIKPELLETIFDSHSTFLESNEKPIKAPSKKTPPFSFPLGDTDESQIEFPFKFGMGTLENIGNAIQHNPEQADYPNLPEEILGKIRSISKIILTEEGIENAPKAEPHCNCMYCQIAHALNEGMGINDIYQEEEEQTNIEVINETTDINLEFQQWNIDQKDDKIYTVTNRLDKEEHYNVFLGTPVGCTCGKEGCDHILAVLKS